jgi:hypothetical protein
LEILLLEYCRQLLVCIFQTCHFYPSGLVVFINRTVLCQVIYVADFIAGSIVKMVQVGGGLP